MKIGSFIIKRQLIITCLLSELMLFCLIFWSASLFGINFSEFVFFFAIYSLISYVIAKYELLFPKNFKSFLNFVGKYTFLFLINIILQFFYLIFNNSSFYYPEIFKYNLLFLGLNFFIHLLLLLILGNKIRDLIWLNFISKESEFEINKYVARYNSINLRKIKFLKINELDNVNLQDVEGICFENDFSVEDNNLAKTILNNKIKKIHIIDWCNYYLEFLPINFLNNNYLKNHILSKKIKGIYSFVKRLGDVFVSTFLLIITLPLMFLVSILIKIEDGGPIFYFQKRTGYKEKIFCIYKFRSMKVDAENSGVQWSTRSDSRITKIGRIIRLTRIDELPQLISVIKGEMSLIGPRPERPEINEILFKETNIYRYRYLIKPGLSGWAQVNYNYAASMKESKNKLGYDMYYLRNSSFLLDILIIFKTIKIIFNLKGALPN